ncbi:MAG: NAD(P)-dependent glycerol-3-phosphate dehydrogenase [Oscillospiraceae bacterium]|jgi:glycerol-3-phosphate dehydrogenase (NAD(P)+)|nr:NAD(P)-dependent glycerol-3-phosphate dehydrogenase [Oscillospiraceae bacterium]
MANITVLGCGFGTALSVQFDRQGHKVTAYTKFQSEVDDILRDGEHKRLLPGVPVPSSISFTTDISKVRDADFVVVAIPTKFLRTTIAEIPPFVTANTIIVDVGKGLEDDTLKRRTEVIAEYLPDNPLVYLTGPCHAEEVGRGMPTAIVAASTDKAAALTVQAAIGSESLRVYASSDIIGCEFGAALKNPIALCVGILEGMGCGDNTRAALMTRGLAEITRLACAVGANPQTLLGLSGVGDLIVTCMSAHSRNHRAGLLIGGGMNAAEAVAKVGTVEGYECARPALRLAQKHGVETPIIAELCDICFGEKKPFDSLAELMQRESKSKE